MERTIQGDFGWRGMNSRVAPERLQPGYASYINNMYPNDEGTLEVRPGWRGILTTAQGYPIYWLNNYRTGDLHRMYWSSNNKLWGVESTGSTTPTDVTGTCTVTSGTGMQGARWGSYLYGIDGVNAMWRINGTSTPLSSYLATTVTSLTTPSTAPGVKLGSSATLVSNLGTLTNYTQPYAMDTGNYYPNSVNITAPNFEGSSGTTIASPWNDSTTGQPTYTASVGSLSGNLAFLSMDSFGGSNVKEYVRSIALTCPDDSDGTGAKLYLLQAYAWASTAGAEAQVLEAQVQLYDGSSTLISGTDAAQYSNVLNSSSASTVTMVFDHRNVTTDPATFKVKLGAPNAVSTKGVNVNRVQVFAPEQKLGLTSSAGSLVVKRGTVLGFNGILYTAGLRIYNTSVSNQNWAGKTGIFFDITTPAEVVNLSLRLLLKSGTTWYSGGMLYKDPSGGYVADLTQFTSTVLGDVDGIGFEFIEDTVIESLVNGIKNQLATPFFGNMAIPDNTIFTLNSVNDAGQLSNGFTYTYRFSEWDGGSITTSTYESADGNESSGSPISVDVTTTGGLRQATVTIPARVNAGSDQYLIWREGGVYDDGRYRLVGVATASASETTFTDNVSDATLYDRPIYQIGRDSFPTGLSAIAVHNGRLWAAKGNTIYVSWVLNEGQETGVYTTITPDPDDPYLGIKGASFTLDASANKDNIKYLIPMGTVMLAIREYSITVISGYDASNFAANTYLRGNDAGMTGGTAAVVRGKAWYMSALGVMEFNGDQPTWVSSDVEGSMTARSTNPQVVYYNDRAFVFNDATTDSFGIGNGYNEQVHVYDYRVNGWVRWTTPGTGTSSAMAIGNVRRTSLYSGSRDGQIYVLNLEGGNSTIAYGDRATPSAAITDVSYEVITRAYGQFENYNPSRLGRGRMTQIDTDVYAASGSNTMTVEVRNDANVSVGTRTYNLPTSRKAYSFRGFLSSAKTIWHRIRFSGAAQVNVLLNATHAFFAESEVPRL